MLGAAQSAVDQAAALLGRVRLIADLDRGALEPRRDLIRLDDLIAATLPALRAEAERRQVDVKVDLAPGLPRVIGDRTHLQDALATLTRSAVMRTAGGHSVTIGSERAEDVVRLTMTHGTDAATDAEHTIAKRLIVALGGRVEEAEGRTTVYLPIAAVPAPR